MFNTNRPFTIKSSYWVQKPYAETVLRAEIPLRHCLGRRLRRSSPLTPDCFLQNSRHSSLAAYHLTDASGPNDFFVSCFGRGGPDLIFFQLFSFLDAA